MLASYSWISCIFDSIYGIRIFVKSDKCITIYILHALNYICKHTENGIYLVPTLYLGFPSSLAGKESACDAEDPGSIPGLGRSPGEGIGYPLRYSWASLVAQMVKNPPAMQETRVQSLGQDDSLEKGLATHPSILAWRTPMDRGACWSTVHAVAKSQTRLTD